MRKKVTTKLGIGLAGLLSGLVGCASNRVNLVEEGRVSVKVIPPKTVRMSEVQVFQDSEELVIFGRIHRGTRLPYWHSKHIDAAVLGPDARPLHEVKTQGYFDHFPRKSYNTISFKIRFPACPPPGSTVVVAYHANAYSNKVTPECLANLGLPEVKKEYQ